MSRHPNSSGPDDPRVCLSGVTIEVYRKPGPISESGVVLNSDNKRASKGKGLSERHDICKHAPTDELGKWAQDFCEKNRLHIANA